MGMASCYVHSKGDNMWQYLTVNICADGRCIDAKWNYREMKLFGSEGWELVTVVPIAVPNMPRVIASNSAFQSRLSALSLTVDEGTSG